MPFYDSISAILSFKLHNDGHNSPTARPSPKDWEDALKIAIDNFSICSNVNNHIYNSNYGNCYWCERSARRKVDIFPPVSNPILPSNASIVSQPKVFYTKPQLSSTTSKKKVTPSPQKNNSVPNVISSQPKAKKTVSDADARTYGCLILLAIVIFFFFIVRLFA